MIEVHEPKELGERHLEILQGGKVLDEWLPHPGVEARTGPLELPQEAPGASLMVSAGTMSRIVVESSSDGGATWAPVVTRASMRGFLVVVYTRNQEHQWLTHLRVKASRAGKGAVKVGMVALRR
jgi:hypothetical protein